MVSGRPGATRTPELTTPRGGPPSGAGAARRGDGRAYFSYAPGLDGVRALAVTAVVIYHQGASWLAGGFLGVDVFFALSGFLITSILVTEWTQHGRIDIRKFYLRRARRLLPALFAMLVGLSLATSLVARSELQRLRGDVLAALTYCTNWTQIAWNRSYFAQLGRPSLLQHLWSLAVEEQFYLLWPVVLVLCLAARRRFVPVAVTLGLAGVSALAMALLFQPGQDPSRVYYGSDTHLAPVLLGAALALLLGRRRRLGHYVRNSAVGGVATDLIGTAGMVVLGYAAVHVNVYSTELYGGGYLIIGLAACALVYAAAQTPARTARVLAAPPMRWVGQRSYAIYLWHWPILMLTRPGVDVPLRGPVLIVLQVAAILIAAQLSYRYVEQPITTRGFLGALQGFNTRPRRSDHPTRPVAGRHALRSAVTVAMLAALTGLAAAILGSASGAPRGIEVDGGKRIAIVVPSVTPSRPPTSVTARSNTGSSPTSSSHAVTPPARRSFTRPVRVSFFGDSQGMTLLLNKPDGLANAITVSDSTVEGCGILLGYIRSSIGFERDLNADCGRWLQIWAAKAATEHPQIAVVEIGAWDVFDDTVNGVTLRFGTPKWDAYFHQQLAQGISILKKAGSQVALMGVPCYRPIAAGGLPLLPERGDDSRTRHLTDLLKQTAAKDPQRVFMISPPSQFCTDPAIATSTAFRWDGVHYYKPGAALTFQVITPQLLAIPQPPQ